MWDMRTYLMMLSALATAITASSSARSVVNFARHFTTAMLPGPAAPVRPGDDGTVVVVSGEVDVCTEASLQQAVLRIMREHGARLLLDVSGISFMDCAGLRALLTTRRRAELRGGFMRLIAVSRA